MNRTDPDPVFAAAVQEELQRRVRTQAGAAFSAPPDPGPRRRWVVELTAIAGILLLVASIGVGVRVLQLRPPVPGGGASIGVTPPSLRTTPPPTAPSSSATTAPPIAGGAALIGPTGAKQRTEAEIRAYAHAQGNTAIWAEQGILDASCMAHQGFLYDPTYRGNDRTGLTDAQYAEWETALYGPQPNASQDWRAEGCNGIAVHETGQDGQN